MSELKKRQRQIIEKKVLNRDDVYHGALEDILLGGWGGLTFLIGGGGVTSHFKWWLGVTCLLCVLWCLFPF